MTDPAGMDLENYLVERSSVNGDIVNVDTFINHRVNTAVMAEIARRMAAIAAPLRPDVIVTAEASGIPPALLTAAEMDLPMVYAKKYVLPGPRQTASPGRRPAAKCRPLPRVSNTPSRSGGGCWIPACGCWW